MTPKAIDGALATRDSIYEDLERIGIERGSTVIVHSSLSSMGWVLGGPSTVVRALLDALGPAGTLSMPAATPHCADPADWTDPLIPTSILEHVREHLPIFDHRITPTSLGAIPETFRTWPGTLRSRHPLESVCARGQRAFDITSDHPLAFSEGRGGPFEKLYEQHAWILLIGVGFNRCTALHFAESLVPSRRVANVRFPVLEVGRRTWLEVPNVANDNDTHFPIVGETFLSEVAVRRGTIGEATSLLLPMRDLVDHAVRYFNTVL